MDASVPNPEALKRALQEQARTPGIYLDHNATTPLRSEVRAAMAPYLEAAFGNPESLHRYGQQARVAVERARAACAKVLNCSPGEIVFTSGGTEANNLALRGLAWARRETSKRIACSAIEHACVRETVRALEAQGFTSTWIAPNAEGQVPAEAVAAVIEGGASVCALMLANNETGVVQPVAEAAAACRGRGVPLHVDAVQAPGKLPLDVEALGCATLAMGAHKFGGPKGAGLLYIRRGVAVIPQLTGGHQEGGMRCGTHDVAGVVGLAEALRLAEAERPASTVRLRTLRDQLELGICAKVPDAVVHGRRADRVANTSFISFPGLRGEVLVRAMDVEGLAVSTGAACSEGTSTPSHVLEAMGVAPDLAAAGVRFSLGASTTALEIRQAVEAVALVSGRLRQPRHD
ncbi:MAG: cysteine desulfurase [Planctomycetes bacterium]|nr:cysteine desulfurase [Planctomycetota bacterium]